MKEVIAAILSVITVGMSIGSEGIHGKIAVFNFDTKTVTLNSGYEMPIYGLGTYSLTEDTCVASVKSELENGGRLIDTAYMYHNEEEVGRGVREAMEEYGIDREDIFVITKLYPNQFSDPETAIEQALEKLDIDYLAGESIARLTGIPYQLGMEQYTKCVFDIFEKWQYNGHRNQNGGDPHEPEQKPYPKDRPAVHLPGVGLAERRHRPGAGDGRRILHCVPVYHRVDRYGILPVPDGGRAG